MRAAVSASTLQTEQRPLQTERRGLAISDVHWQVDPSLANERLTSRIEQHSRRLNGVTALGCPVEHIGDHRDFLAGGAPSVTEAAQGRAAAEPLDLHPANLLSPDFSGDLPARTASSIWWLAHTRPRQEKAVAAALYARKVAYYLPLLTRKSLLRGRPRFARVPLFPGYVFLFGNQEDRLASLKTNRLLTVQPVPDGERLRGQLRTFADFIAAGVPLVRESRLLPGERVRIKAGPFRGTEGVVLRRNGKTELLVAIDFLHQGASLEIEDCMLEPV